MKTDEPTGNAWQLTLATGAFAVCFSVFGSVSAMMPVLRERLGLTPLQVSIALAVPVLLGSLGRIPLGMLADRYGGRVVFAVSMFCAALPALAMGWVGDYASLLFVGFLLGISLATFSIGVGFVSRWYPLNRQGLALGVYGMGNIGQSLAAFGAPTMATLFGYAWGFWTFALITLAWLVLFAIGARNSSHRPRPQSMRQMLVPLADRASWRLSLYYFLTFGGFVAMSIYMPTFLTDIFGLTPQDAGLRTAGFVVLATAVRPLGGMLADRIGGHRVLVGVFPCTAGLALLMALPWMATFTVGALGVAAAIGLGNGAVFKLVPQYFPNAVGSVTGLVGAAGGLGGFFPPLAVGVIYQLTDSYAPGFVLLAIFALFCLVFAAREGRLQAALVANG